jgi:hypothetical protein
MTPGCKRTAPQRTQVPTPNLGHPASDSGLPAGGADVRAPDEFGCRIPCGVSRVRVLTPISFFLPRVPQVRGGNVGLEVVVSLLRFPVTAGLKRYYGQGHLHFITFSCYRRLPLLKTLRARHVFVKELAKARDDLGFHLLGYVVMPEHVHLLRANRPAGRLRRCSTS